MAPRAAGILLPLDLARVSLYYSGHDVFHVSNSYTKGRVLDCQELIAQTLQRPDMARLTLQNLGTEVRKKRGNGGLRETAREIGTSAPTLSRVESGKMPDLQTFSKLCRWLEVDPGEILNVTPQRLEEAADMIASAHLKAKREISPATARAFTNLIVKAQQRLADLPGEINAEGL